MEKKLKEKWIKALRSGKFKQGKRCLRARRFDGSVCHCCLGVLCEIQDKNWHKRKYRNAAISHPLISRKVSHAARENLAEMNDGANGPQKSFSEIADWIEANL